MYISASRLRITVCIHCLARVSLGERSFYGGYIPEKMGLVSVLNRSS